MRSANGRHRRPRQAPALIVAAGVTGSAIAIPLLGAAGAGAAEASTWDHVAECESGGTWSADLGNGYYGGLQISQANWDTYGGGKYAVSPDLASRSQQIAVAEKILAAQGPQAWPSCASISGLRVGGAAPGVDPGSAPEASSGGQSISPANGSPVTAVSGGTGASTAAGQGDDSTGGTTGDITESHPGGSASDAGTAGSTGSTDLSGTGVTAEKGLDAPSSDVPPTVPAPGTAGSVAPAGSAVAPDGTALAPADAAQGKHRGQAASPEASVAGAQDEAGAPGRHASPADATASEEGAADAADDDYTVEKGDTLWVIAADHEPSQSWHALYQDNKDVIGSDPDLILPGQNLELSAK
jgi:LysM repeat protein